MLYFANRLLKIAPIMILMALMLFISVNAFSQAQKDTKKSIIETQNDISPLQKFIGDSIRTVRNNSDKSVMPGKIGDVYSSEQDSNYFRALKLKISATSRFAQDLKKFEGNWVAEREATSGIPLSVAAKNMFIPKEILSPTAAQQVMHDYNTMQSLSVPFIRTYNPMSGLQVSLSTIGQFLGLVEDVSPNLEYKIDYGTEVEVVIYSMKAYVIATIFKGQQSPGSYKFTWNARDDNGRRVVSGDYIGEIRIGKEKYVRKRIYIP